MKNQLQIISSFLVLFLGLGLSTSYSQLTPPSGKGGTSTCSSSSESGGSSNSSSSTVNCDNQNSGGNDKNFCYDLATGDTVNCDTSDLRLICTVVVPITDPGKYPDAITVNASVRHDLFGTPHLSKSISLTPDQIFEYVDQANNESWSNIVLPWLPLSEGHYYIDYEIVSSYCQRGCNDEVTNTSQQLVISEDANGDMEVNYYDLGLVLHTFSVFPNPTSDGNVNFQYELYSTSGQIIGNLIIRKPTGELVTQDRFDASTAGQVTISLNSILSTASSSNQSYIYQLLFTDKVTGETVGESGWVFTQ